MKSDKVPFKRKPIFWVESNSAYPGLMWGALRGIKTGDSRAFITAVTTLNVNLD